MNTPPSDDITQEEKRNIFFEELSNIEKRRFLSSRDFLRVKNAYDQYYYQITKQKQHEAQRLRSQDKAPIEPEKNELTSNKESQSVREPILEKKQIFTPKKAFLPPKPPKTAEQVRERNISVVLVTGVILLLFGGLILATSSWGNLNVSLKVFLISMVSVLFGGIAFVSFKLKIDQTAFAFLTLASLFFPISILSASYYKIFGNYLSLDGEGAALIGFLGGLVCITIYFRIANYFKSKLFILISLLTFTMTFLFGFNYLAPTKELLFLLMTLFNLVLLSNVHYVKNQQRLILFQPFVFQFIQLKTIVESFVILTLFTSNILYSITLLLLSVNFLILSYKFNQKLYHFAFSIVFTYGYAHLVFNSALDEFDIISFALLPLFFTALYVYMAKSNSHLSRNFYYTSLVASILSLFYAHSQLYQGDYTQLSVAMMILSAQLIYLALHAKIKIVTYPALVLFNLALVYLGLALNLSISTTLLFLFAVQVALYLGVYLFNHEPNLSLFKDSGLYISGCVMILITVFKFTELSWLEVSSMFVITAALLLLTYFKDNSKLMKTLSTNCFAPCLSLSLIVLQPYFEENSLWYSETFSVSIHFILISLLIIGIVYLFLKKYPDLFNMTFITGQTLSLLAVVTLIDDSVPSILITAILAIATAINILSVYLYRYHLLWILVVFTSAGIFASLFNLFSFTTPNSFTAMLLLGPILFMAIAELTGKYSKTGRLYFFWFSHFFNVLTSIAGYIFISSYELFPLLYVMPIMVYAYSAWTTKFIRNRYIFTYFGLTTLFLQVILAYQITDSTPYMLALASSITSLLIGILWGFSNIEWKRVIAYYLLPFLHLSMIIYIAQTYSYGFPQERIFVWVGFVTLQLMLAWYLMIDIKREGFVFVTLIAGSVFFTMYADTLALLSACLLQFALVIILLMLSKNYYTSIIKKQEGKTTLDFYRVFALFLLVTINERVFMHGDGYFSLEFIVACCFVAYFLIIRQFTKPLTERKIYLAAAVITCLYPYSIILNELTIPAVIATEVWIIPLFIISTVLFRKIFDSRKVTQNLDEFAVTFILFAILIVDALQSNTIEDALVIGVISLVAIVFGFMMKYKSYFFAGTGTILLNIYINTKSLWGNLPWWLYLIIGGLVLIAMASFFEWRKQKDNTSSKDILATNKQRFKRWFSKWN